MAEPGQLLQRPPRPDATRRTGEPFNEACAASFRMRKAEIGASMTFTVLADATGIKLQQLKYFLNNQQRMHLDEFLRIALALGLDPATEVTKARARAAEAGS